MNSLVNRSDGLSRPEGEIIQKMHLPVAEWIWSSSPISDSRRKVLYGDAVISCRKAVISGGPRQVLPRRAAIPAVNLTSVFSTSAFVPARSTMCRPRASHFICLNRFLASAYFRFHHAKLCARRIYRGRSLFSLNAHGTHVIDFVFYVSHARSPFWKTDSFDRLKMQIVLSRQVREKSRLVSHAVIVISSTRARLS